ncbi:MAG: SUMF1/EgtB/PvdO family nonheme iron enzyme [Magnetococcales bacterium]|nr:SUMF1/EgtB/PvdO family nonheme iron enzyme [Magnetococcales bacterium]
MLKKPTRGNGRRVSQKPLPPMERGHPDGAVRSGRRRRRLLVLLFLTLFLGMGMARYLGNGRDPGPPSAGQTPPGAQACQLHDKEGSSAPEMIEIPDGEYNLARSSLAPHVQASLVAADLSRILVKKPYLIQVHAVSQEEFARYEAHVQALAEGEEKNRLLVQIGMHWKKVSTEVAEKPKLISALFGGKTRTPLQSISWEAAQGYAEWMGGRSGCPYHLPSREEWAAALMYLHGELQPKRQDVAGAGRYDLLLGVREWTRSPCAGGYFLAGGDAARTGEGMIAGQCMPAMVSIAGFRMVLKRNGVPDRQSGPSPRPAS